MRSATIPARHWAIVVFILANIADAATTMGSLSGGARELNPIVAALIGSLGLETALALKVLLASAAGAVLYWRKRRVVLVVLTVALAIISVDNVVVSLS